MEERSGSLLSELPYTNRGVIRQKEELSALIDWCQITIKEVPLEAVIEDVLRIPLELMTVTWKVNSHIRDCGHSCDILCRMMAHSKCTVADATTDTDKSNICIGVCHINLGLLVASCG